MSNPADLCRECELLQKVQLLEKVIKELIFAIDDTELCLDCSTVSDEIVCETCPWHQAKVRAIRLLAKEEEAE